ncbi:MAG: tellurite resistance TerB family protein [Notoacmeibacter sp.]|nr:tellurite resistance TerB family protein [Notoacmeibacter sp.]
MASVAIQDALVQVMVLMSAVDRSMSDEELARIGSLVRSLPVFEGYDEDRIIPAAQACQRTLQKPEGLSGILGELGDIIPARLRDTAYALAVEVAAVDLQVEQEELRLLKLFRDHFMLDRLTVSAIERGAQARYRTMV